MQKINFNPIIIVVGIGANGSYTTQHITQMLASYNLKDFKLLLADTDTFEEKNLNNQLCIRNDLGKKKASVLAQRYGNAYSMNIATYTLDFIETVEKLNSLFDVLEGSISETSVLPYKRILISCVDNTYTRKIFHDFFNQESDLVYIDSGVHTVYTPEEKQQYKWTDDEWERHNASGYSGQVVLGIKQSGNVLLKPVAALFPDILDNFDNEIAPSKLSCTDLASSEPQRMITNKWASLAITSVLNNIILSSNFDEINTNGVLFNARTMALQPIKKI